MYDWENGIALHAMQGILTSSFGERKVSWVSSCCDRNLGYILELQRGCPFETGVSSAKSGHLSRYNAHLRNLNLSWQDKTDASEGEAEGQASISSCTVILGFLSIFKKSQASSPFEALNSACLLNCQGM